MSDQVIYVMDFTQKRTESASPDEIRSLMRADPNKVFFKGPINAEAERSIASFRNIGVEVEIVDKDWQPDPSYIVVIPN